MFSEIGAYDAKTKLAELLRQVKDGQRFTITHRGKPVADLVPSGGMPAPDADAAVDDMLNFERIAGVGADQIADWIAEGRR
jgi:prevent-host-death family protein